MVVPSKIFLPPINTNHCSQSILHPGIGCLRDFLNNMATYSLGGLKYFSPLLITPLVLKFKTMNQELLLNTLKYYLKTVWWVTMAGSTSFYCICIFRNYLGRFRKYTTLFVPTVMGMQFCWLFPDKVMKLFSTATSQAVFESLLRQFSNPVTRLLLHSTSVQTFLFMINSAIILHCQRLKVYRGFWFMQPYALEAAQVEQVTTEQGTEKYDVNANLVENYEKSPAKCVHGNMTCSNFVWDGIKCGLTYGIPMDLLGALMKGGMPKGCQGIGQAVVAKLKTFRPNMMGFFILYGGIYRLSSCVLHKYYGHLSAELQHILAAFLGGSAYMWVDKVSFYTLSTVIAIQALWQQFCNRVVSSKANSDPKKKTNLALRLLKDVPFARLVFSLNMGYLVHNFVMNYEVLNSFTRGFLDGLTSNKTKSIRDAITNHTVEELMAIANSNAVKTFL